MEQPLDWLQEPTKARLCDYLELLMVPPMALQLGTQMERPLGWL